MNGLTHLFPSDFEKETNNQWCTRSLQRMSWITWPSGTPRLFLYNKKLFRGQRSRRAPRVGVLWCVSLSPLSSLSCFPSSPGSESRDGIEVTFVFTLRKGKDGTKLQEICYFCLRIVHKLVRFIVQRTFGHAAVAWHEWTHPDSYAGQWWADESVSFRAMHAGRIFISRTWWIAFHHREGSYYGDSESRRVRCIRRTRSISD